MRKLAIAAVLIAAVLTTGGRKPVTAADAAQFKVGVSSYHDVVAKLGNPASVASESDGRRTATYVTIHARPKATLFIPVVGMFAGGARGETDIAVFMFGPDGLLERSSVTDANVDCSAGVFAVGCGGRGRRP